MSKRIPVDVVAASYVELTVAIVALEHRLERLEAQVTRLAQPGDTAILAEQLEAIEAFARRVGIALK